MRKKREFIQGAFYHVTSRTNDKIRIFQKRLGRKIMLMVLQDAKDKFRFRLANFCVMPTHIHQPAHSASLSAFTLYKFYLTETQGHRGLCGIHKLRISFILLLVTKIGKT